MKKFNFLILFCLISITTTFAQGSLGKGGKQINAGLGFSNFGTPVYVGVDFGVHESITVGPVVSYRNYRQDIFGTKFSQNLTVIGFNGNYHFNQLLALPGEWDLYAGLTLGYYLWSSNDAFATAKASGVGFGGQAGVRYFFSEKFGMNLEFGGGNASGGSIGVTFKL